MKITLTTLALVAVSFASAQAFQFTVDIDSSATIVADDGVTPFSGSLYLGYFGAGTNFANAFDSLDSTFFAVTQGAVSGAGFQLGLSVPTGGTWANGTLNWTSSAGQDATWDTTFNGQPMTMVFMNVAPRSDGFLGTPNSTLFDGVTEYLILDTQNAFFNAALSGLGSSFATIDSTDPILKTSGPAVIPEPTSFLLLLSGLGFLAARRRRA